MRMKILLAALALTVAMPAMVSTSAMAQGWRHGGGHHHGGWNHGWHRGAGIGFGLGAGLANSYHYNSYAYQPDYMWDDDGYDGSYSYGGSASRDDAYCAQKYRSYDPSSGTYLGYDGQRHPCQ